MKWFKELKESWVTAWCILLRKLIPAKILTIKIRCPLTGDHDIMMRLVIQSDTFEMIDILNSVIKTMDKHMESEHHLVGYQGFKFVITGHRSFTICFGNFLADEMEGHEYQELVFKDGKCSSTDKIL